MAMVPKGSTIRDKLADRVSRKWGRGQQGKFQGRKGAEMGRSQHQQYVQGSCSLFSNLPTSFSLPYVSYIANVGLRKPLGH